MKYSNRAKTNMTKQLKAQLKFYQDDLKHERAALAKAKSYLKYNLSGVKSMVSQHEQGVRKTLVDITNLKIRIRNRQRKGEIFKIL